MGQFYSCKKILRYNADINIVYGTRSNGKSFAILQNAVIDYLNGLGGLAYIRRRKEEARKSNVDKYFRDSNFIKWLEEYTKGKYNHIFCKAGDLFICKKSDGEVDKDSIALFGSAFSLQDSESNKSLHYEFCYNLVMEEALTRKAYLDEEAVMLEHLVSTIQRNGGARLWLIGNTVSRVCPYFDYWGLKGVRTQKVGTIVEYKKHVTKVRDGEAFEDDMYIAVEFAENKTDKTNVIALGKKRESIVGNEWEHDEHPKIWFNLDDADILYVCFYEYMSFVFRLQIVFYKDAPYLYVYPFTREGLRLSKSRDIFTEKFETADNRWNKMCLPQHTLMRDLIRNNKAIYSDDMCGDEFLQCLKSFNPFRII